MTSQNYTIFINQIAIHIEKSRKELKPEMEYLLFCNLKKKAIDLYYQNSSSNQDLFLYSYNPKKLMQLIQNKLTCIEASGGIVMKDKLILCIYRRKFWDLPKGKIEKNEKITTAAIREVEEETGVQGLYITSELTPTYHLYKEKQHWVLKKTYWFLMKSNQKKISLQPQTEEYIEEVAFKPVSFILDQPQSTYRNITALLHQTFGRFSNK